MVMRTDSALTSAPVGAKAGKASQPAAAQKAPMSPVERQMREQPSRQVVIPTGTFFSKPKDR